MQGVGAGADDEVATVEVHHEGETSGGSGPQRGGRVGRYGDLGEDDDVLRDDAGLRVEAGRGHTPRCPQEAVLGPILVDSNER